MKRIAIEEAMFYPQINALRADWAKRENAPDCIDKDFLINEVGRQLAAPLDSFRIPQMDAAGIAMQVLSSGSPGVHACADADQAVALAREMNDQIHDVMQRFPDRFGGFCALPTQDPDAAAKEMERCKALGFHGAMVQGRTEGKYLDDPRFYPIWEAAEALHFPISLHVLDTNVGDMRIFEGCYSLLGPGWSWNLEAATHVMRIVMNGIFERYPKAELICGHMGEGLPYYFGRMDEGYMTFSGHMEGKLTRLPSTYFTTNVYITTSGRYHPPAMRCAIDAMGIDRILFACDYPFVPMEDGVRMVEDCRLTQEEEEKIFHLNAERVLGIR